jgi:hypothetical protein
MAAYEMGGLDLNVKPKDTAVYLDGDYVGTTRHFDGYPGHLWVSAGMHEITFHLPGFKTISRRYRVLPGILLKVRFRMEPGDTTPPPEPKVEAPAAIPQPAPAVPEEAVQDSDVAAAAGAATEAPSTVGDEVAAGRIRLSVSPAEATVYLDGRFLGLAKDLGGEAGLFAVKPGTYTVEVMSPGYRARKVEVVVEEDAEQTVEITLEKGI